MNNKDREEALTLELLEAIEAKSDVTQRHLADSLGVALGLANSYLKRCVRKGLVKIKQAPANRYLYYLTPKGFAEKSRLTAQYLSYSFSFYRRAGESCARAFRQCEKAGWTRVGLYGASDLAEIAAIRAAESKVSVTVVCDPEAEQSSFVSIPVIRDVAADGDVHAWILTDFSNPVGALEELTKHCPRECIVVPDILAMSPTE
ncbi:MAG: winged helix-turn-helix transcriptional regulator [Gammaproteobacteria bacterium]|nr:winged helix-turn-helix transcriptional regulator [Gammaproteobacteria bacterium]MDH3411599.1 winged helix-turn-helix transcriptional regulator [Gammaproteobacteria bacterium]